jgi:hypothetical protein
MVKFLNERLRYYKDVVTTPSLSQKTPLPTRPKIMLALWLFMENAAAELNYQNLQVVLLPSMNQQEPKI